MTNKMDNMLDDALGVIKEGQLKLSMFKSSEIRVIFHNNEWFYSIIDVVGAVVETKRASQYWTDLKSQLVEIEGVPQLYDKIVKLRMGSNDGKFRKTECTDVETIFRIIQSIPSKKAEIFKRWLARVGYERIQEMQNPEIGIKRNMAQYRANGMPDEWIKTRVKGTLTRNELTEVWSKRGVKEGKEYGHLTNAISKNALGVTAKEHKKHKRLGNQPLRDHMSTLELAIMNLGEAATAEFARVKNAQGFNQNLKTAEEGGEVAGEARQKIEDKTGKKVLTDENFIDKNKKLPLKK